MTRGTNRAHFARAALEAMAYGTAEMLAVMAKRAKVSFQSLRVDGGASANNWMLQFQSDILGIPVERPDMIETTALGAAGLAGIAGGVWQDASEFIGTRQFTRFTPVMPRESADELMEGWQRAVRATLFWARDKGEPGSKKKKKRPVTKSRASSKAKKSAAKKSARKKPGASRGRKR